MPKKVLIADDSGTVREVIRAFLEKVPDLEVCGEAIDGLSAIEKSKELHPDLVLLDLSMPSATSTPSINGAEVASILKKTIPGVRIILFTMYSEDIGKALTSHIGVDAVLSKPDGMARLVETINFVLAKPS
jgi:DNA-binding NarL/FixJ family response regulator